MSEGRGCRWSLLARTVVGCCCRCRALGRRVAAHLAVYCSHGCLVGTRYLVLPGYHWTERLFWALCLALSLLGCSMLVRDYAGLYATHVSRLVAEDNPPAPLPFPAVALCESGRWLPYSVPIKWRIPGHASAGHHQTRLRMLMKALVFQDLLGPSMLRSFVALAKAANLSASMRYLKDTRHLEPLAHQVRASCWQLFGNCSWNLAPFECCAHFRPLRTPHGTCFLLNSRLTEGGPTLNMTVSKHSELAVLHLNFTRNAKIFVLPAEDLPESVSPLPKFAMTADRHEGRMGFVMTPVVVDPELAPFGPEVVNCLQQGAPGAHWVPGLNDTYRLRSYGACLADCIRMLQRRACGCINYVLNRGRGEAAVKPCDFKGYLCLERTRLLYVGSLHLLKDTPCRRCLPSCTSYYVKIAHFQQRPSEDLVGDNRSIAISLLVFPPKRLHLQRIRDTLDILVSLGGILSLFLGFSLTSVIEFLFIVCRPQPPPPPDAH